MKYTKKGTIDGRGCYTRTHSLDNIKCTMRRCITATLSIDEAQLIMRFAKVRGISVSRAVKQMALEYAREHESEVPELYNAG